MASEPSGANLGSAIAIVGMGCRVPGAANPLEFWRNLRDGVESVRPIPREALIAAGLSPAELVNPHHVPVGALVDGIDMFDAAFFGIPGREAELMDPQHRLFLECAWESLEDAGYDPARYKGPISVFGGGIFDSYVTWNLLPAGIFDDKAGILQTVLANEKDYMTARVAYKLNLRGAACNVQTGCSTSLVAVHMACQSLLNLESDVALAGGVAVDVARPLGYYYHEGSVYSADGHCRAFDADAKGTVFGNGVAIVVLRRLEDAIADGDNIRAIILGTAINNDGSLKVGFTAPAVNGQSEVIVEALAAAGVGSETIGYVETHGTGTALGDPIEIQAMARAFAGPARPSGSCLIGSVKTNIGHLDAAAGTSGLIKTVLALENRAIPPTLHFRRPNPELGIERTPFAVAAELSPWTAGTTAGVPRRAGVSSFGIGGTNAHAVLQEAPVVPVSRSARPAQLLVLAARSQPALDEAGRRLAAHLRAVPEVNLSDVAFTLQVGRAMFVHRRAVVCRDTDDAAAALEDASRHITHESDGRPLRIGFMFPGQGAQYAGMGRSLYATEPVFRREIDACALALRGQLDLLSMIDAARGEGAPLTATVHAQPALFAVEYALARLWESWGVQPDGLVGHSLGEYVAACLAGVFSLRDALTLVAARGRLMQEMPSGAMTAVPSPRDRFDLPGGLDIAAVNAPGLTVVSGPTPLVERFEADRRATGVECRRLHTSHAFHSASMDPVLEPYRDLVSGVSLNRPARRFISNVTGTWITDEEATSAEYWARHLRAPVMFAAGVQTLLGAGIDLLLEVGPGRTLGTLARLQSQGVGIAASLPAAQERADDHAVLLDAVGRLWARGADLDWTAFHAPERRRRVSLPTYPFEHRRYWIEPNEAEVERKRARARANEKNPDPSGWLYVRCWKQTPPAAWSSSPDADAVTWLIVPGESAVGRQIASALGRRVPGDRVLVADDSNVESLASSLSAGGNPLRVVHLASAGPLDPAAGRRRAIDEGFYSVARLGAALSRLDVAATVKVVTAGADAVIGTETLVPERALVSGPCLSLSQEQRGIACQRIDVQLGDGPLSAADEDAVVAELMADSRIAHVAIRGGHRWVPGVERLQDSAAHPHAVRSGGHYLIVGGFGTIGMTIASYLAKYAKARISIVGRSALPDRSAWPEWVDSHDAADATAVRIQRARLLEQLGGEVHTVSADATVASQLRDAIADAERRFGAVNGVIFAAGLMDETAFAPVDSLRPAAAERHFGPKLDGLPALDAALAGRSLDFCVITSSLSVLLGGTGYAAYTAANAYVDAYVLEHNRRSDRNWVVVNWDAWHPFGASMPATSLLGRLAITPVEGATAFALLMRCRRLHQVFVSTADLQARIDEHTELPRVVDARAVNRDGECAAVEREADALAGLSPTERTVIGVWQDVLGITGIQLYDGFLDLGGSSLTAVQVIGRIEEQTGVHVSIEEFIFQTAGQLAALIDARRPTAGELVGGAAAQDADAAEPRRRTKLSGAFDTVRT